MTTTTLRPAIRRLLRQLAHRAYTPAQGPKAWQLTQCWLSRETANRHSLIVPAGYGPLDYMCLVAATTIDDAVTAGLITLGEPQPMPPYNYGGPRYRWRTIQQGRTIALTPAGHQAVDR